MKYVKIDIPNKECTGLSVEVDENFPLQIINDPKQFKPADSYKVQLRVTVRTDYKQHQKKITKLFSKHQSLLQAIKLMNTERYDIQVSLKNGSIQKERTAKKASNTNQILNGHSLLNVVFQDYITGKQSTLKSKTVVSYKSFYDTWLKESVGKMKMESITRNDLQKVVRQILSQRAPRTAKTLKEVLNPIFKEFFHKGMIDSNPVELLEFKKFDNVKNPDLSDEQIKALYAAIYGYELDPYRSIFVWLATGRRVNEVLTLKWSDINLQKETYTVLPDNNKAGKRMEYTLDEDLLAIVKTLDRRGEYVFPAIKNPVNKMHNDTLKKHWVKILMDAGLTVERKTKEGDSRIVPMLRIHDLRHIVGLKLVNAGVSLEIIASVLGHTTTSITKRYSKVRTETASQALSRFKELVKE